MVEKTACSHSEELKEEILDHHLKNHCEPYHQYTVMEYQLTGTEGSTEENAGRETCPEMSKVSHKRATLRTRGSPRVVTDAYDKEEGSQHEPARCCLGINEKPTNQLWQSDRGPGMRRNAWKWVLVAHAKYTQPD